MRQARHDILFEPLQVGPKTLRNRFYAVPHALFSVDRRSSEVAFRRMKAEGGWAAVCGGIISIRSDNWDGRRPRIWDPDDLEALRSVAAAVRGEGALAGIELGYGGAHRGGKFDAPLGPSPVADPSQPGVVPREMGTDEIDSLQETWAAGAATAIELGYDIVYAYGASGYLPAQFLSAYFNRRRDGYGGSLERRARFWLELLARIREAVQGRAIVAVRIGADALCPEGVPLSETLDFVRLADDLVDLWDVNVGWRWAPDSAPARFGREGFQLEWSGKIRQATTKPIVGVGRLTDPDRMAEIVRSGAWDLIGGARPSIADPFLPRKIEEGRYGEIRECTGSNFCIASELTPAGLSCVQNPTVGEEHRRSWHPERPRLIDRPALDVLIVGGGPAGLECAHVLGQRGFRRVHLVDRAAELGGHLRWLTRLPGLTELGRVISYRLAQLEGLANVDVITDTELSPDEVAHYGADLVVLATGSSWASGDATLSALAPCGAAPSPGLSILTPEEIMLRGCSSGDRAVIWDRDGSLVAVGLAEKLAGDGVDVTFVSAFETVAPRLDASFEGVGVRRRLRDLGVRTVLGRTLAGVEGHTLTFQEDHDAGELTIDADSLILAVQRLAEDRLERALRADEESLREAGVRGLHSVGDCVAPRELGFVMSDARRLGEELGEPQAAF